ncbi:hypothetical protein Ae201684_005612 [Aphanomyces euteiches]|uniref:Thioesterase domain-containing protein n=1 Tax=Aphanomyces euteiches TaxID=100861 RepID=A0A6G0XER4_9STRA|nr:hypothetical protein Ae201684_005612 [Aphanomyces euteiches]
MLSSLRRLPSSFRRFATKSSGAAYFASPNKVSLAVPTKIAEIAADSNYVALTKDMVWNNPQVPTRRSEDQDDFFFPNIHEPGKYEAVQVFGHKDKTNVVAWVHLGRQLCGAKGILHGGCIATVFDELFVTTADCVGYTATMTVNFRRPFVGDKSGLFYVDLDRAQSRSF